MKTRVLSAAGLVALTLAVALVSLPGSASSAAAEPGGITVRGSASVSSAPDRAELSFGVESSARTASAAIAANAAEMRKVIAAIRAAGGGELETRFVSLSPRFTQQNDVDSFVATNTVSARITDLTKVGALIDAAVAAGANRVDGPSFARGERIELYRQALRAAVANARGTAQVLATASKVSLGRITDISEGSSGPVAVVAGTAAAGSTPIEPGTQQITASVSVTFSIS